MIAPFSQIRYEAHIIHNIATRKYSSVFFNLLMPGLNSDAMYINKLSPFNVLSFEVEIAPAAPFSRSAEACHPPEVPPLPLANTI